MFFAIFSIVINCVMLVCCFYVAFKTAKEGDDNK